MVGDRAWWWTLDGAGGALMAAIPVFLILGQSQMRGPIDMLAMVEERLAAARRTQMVLVTRPRRRKRHVRYRRGREKVRPRLRGMR